MELDNVTLTKASRGLREIFISQILGVFTVALSLALIAVGVLAAGSGWVTGFAAVLGFAALAGSLVSFVLYLLGLNRLNGTHPCFHRAFVLVLVNIGVTVAKSLAPEGVPTLLLEIACTAIMVLVVHYVCHGASHLLQDLGEHILAGQGHRVALIHLVCGGINIACLLLAHIGLLAWLAHILEVAALLAEVVGAVLYMSFLCRGSRALSAAAGIPA